MDPEKLEEEKDQTEDLEKEELTGAAEDEDEEEEEPEMSDGRLLYELLLKRGALTEGNWFHLEPTNQSLWERVASDLQFSDVHENIVEELQKK